MGLLSKAKTKKTQTNNQKTEPIKQEPEKKEDLIKDNQSIKTSPIELNKIETEFDILYKMVQTKGSVKISTISGFFNIPKKTAEEWAQILDMHGLVELHYPPVGEPELRKKNEPSDKKERTRT